MKQNEVGFLVLIDIIYLLLLIYDRFQVQFKTFFLSFSFAAKLQALLSHNLYNTSMKMKFHLQRDSGTPESLIPNAAAEKKYALASICFALMLLVV